MYEDLPGGQDDLIQEDLYDSIETYQQEKLPPLPKQAAAPPLPSISTIPSTSGPPLPARNDPPSLPPRNQLAPTVSGTRINAVPPPPMAAPPPPIAPPHPPMAPPVSPKSPVSPHGNNSLSSISAKDVSRLKPVKSAKPPPKRENSSGGIDMKTIQQEALKKRGHINLEALEKKNRKEDISSDTQAPPPWAAQLKRRKPVDTVSNTSTEEREEENLAPWVRSKRGSISEDAPQWVRKRLDLQSEAPPPVAKKPIKETISEVPTVNGNYDSLKPAIPVAPKPAIPVAPKPSPKLAPKPGHLPTKPPSLPATKPRPPIAPKVVSPKPSPALPPRSDSLDLQETTKPFHTLPRAAGPKKVPPPKPPRSDVPLSPTEGENGLFHNDIRSPISELGPPKFTPELPSSSPFAQVKEKSKPPTVPKRLPPPSVPAPPPPSEVPNEIGPPTFSPPISPAPPPPLNSAPSPPMNPAPPPPTSTVPPPITSMPPSLPTRQVPALPPQVPQLKRYRRRQIPSHNAYNPPSVPDRATKPGRNDTIKPAMPAPPMAVRPQIKAPIAAPSLPDKPPPPIPTGPMLQQNVAPAPPPPPPPEEYECDDFYDDVDTVKRAMPSANVNKNITGVTTTESK